MEILDSNEIPVWVKNNADWWAEDSINDSEFVNTIQFLIEGSILVIPFEDGDWR